MYLIEILFYKINVFAMLLFNKLNVILLFHDFFICTSGILKYLL